MTIPSLALGSTIDNRYIIQHFLAQGGSAEVYLARHRFLNRDVVVKIPTRGITLAQRERFEREARALSHVKHPGLVELVDVGEHEGSLYLALEHMKGRTLGGLLAARGRLEPADVVKIGVNLSIVIGHCHSLGVIHRDVKPDNVFILRGAENRLKLFDFGIARLEYDASQHPGRNTQEVSVLGTPEYMAPEALEMRPGIDHRVDIYAFGILLYELLCGAVPFEGTYGEILVKLTNEGTPSLRSARPELPADLLSVVDRCLAQDPSERFPTMQDVTEALGQVESQLGSTEKDVHGGGARERQPATVLETPAARHAVAGPPPPPPRGVEARRHPRAPYTTLASLIFGEVTLNGRVEEISAGGVQFLADAGGQYNADAAAEVGKRGELKFVLPLGGRLYQVSATVRWTRVARAGRLVVGLEFVAPSSDATKLIEEYVRLMGGA